jgi:hypothetical protein
LDGVGRHYIVSTGDPALDTASNFNTGAQG